MNTRYQVFESLSTCEAREMLSLNNGRTEEKYSLVLRWLTSDDEIEERG